MDWYEMASALGGTEVLGDGVVSGSTFIHKLEQGFPRQVVVRFKQFSGLTDNDLVEVIPRRTLTHIRGAPRLTAEQSDKLARMAGVAVHAQRVFGSPEGAVEWLRTANPALGGELPLRMLKTGSGATLVDSVLTRIEYGVYE